MSRIINYTWDDFLKSKYSWIKIDDTYYNFIMNNLINNIFPNLIYEDKILLTTSLIKVINLINIKFNFYSGNEEKLWKQLIENNLMDMYALLGLLLPYINDNEKGDNKKLLTNLSDLYLKKDASNKYLYTNSQYNRCIRQRQGHDIIIFERPFLKEYFIQNLELLLTSINSCSNKLYINWINILPIPINNYMNTNLFKSTEIKIKGNLDVNMINNYIDFIPGLSYQDIYNTVVNQLFYQIKNCKWLIYDIKINGKLIPYIIYLEKYFTLKYILNNYNWSQLNKQQQDIFTYEWKEFLNNKNLDANTVLDHVYFFFSKYHKNRLKLIKTGKLILNKMPDEDENDEEDIIITPELTKDAINGMNNVPADEIYLFFKNQLSDMKKTWYYYMLMIQKNEYVISDNDINITAKNIYNYAKSMSHFMYNNKFTPLPKYWTSLKPEWINILLYRINDIPNEDYNNWNNPKGNWFNINKYIRKFYPNIDKNNILEMNHRMHILIRQRLINIIFESLIYTGLLSEFVPHNEITDNQYIETSIGSDNDKEKTKFQYKKMQELIFNKEKRGVYENYCYYFLTYDTYGNLPILKSKDFDTYNNEKKYFDYLTQDQGWTFTYAMNWISQINFYHHYINTRITYITGSTGVGKSTQSPKLFMYCLKMLNFNINGKIVCTQPRIEPTVKVAMTIALEMGVPITEYNKEYDKEIASSNYYIQYKYSTDQHTSNINSFLRIVTDGLLLEQIRNSPFLSRMLNDVNDINRNKIEWMKTYLVGNIYDIVIVDEAHEHNTNMDMILTLMRDAAYVNNSLKLIIVTATLEDDEPIYRRYYRIINDNRSYPINALIEDQKLDRTNVDRRIHISPPGQTTRYIIIEHYPSKELASQINESNYVEYGINETLKVVNSTTDGDILLFMAGQSDIIKAMQIINQKTSPDIICFGFYGELSEEQRTFIINIDKNLKTYTRYKEDYNLDEKDIIRRVPEGTYKRAIIIATNIAEASITLRKLKYVIDTGYAKVNIYDPLESISKLITLPISYSSSIQRRGRVGRISSGEVFYLYERSKIINNKTTYKIADSDMKDIIIKLIKNISNDFPIITKQNDINDVHNLNKINEILSENNINDYSIYSILKNPSPYLDIIIKQYMYLSNITYIDQYYTYYGKASIEEQPNIQDMDKYSFLRYITDNHDDYHYQEKLTFISRCYTGYDDFILRDHNLTFYIIHPDENVITRNLFTGQMIGLKCSQSVTPGYYYYLLITNNIIQQNMYINNYCDTELFNKANHIIKNNQFDLQKYNLALDDAKIQLLVIDIPTTKTNYNNIMIFKNFNILQNSDVNRILSYQLQYNKYIDSFYKHFKEYAGYYYITIRSLFYFDLLEVQNVLSLDILRTTNNILWYVFSIPYNIQDDVLAIMYMIQNIPSINYLLAKNTFNKEYIKRYFSLYTNKWGDIYFLWTLWNNIKKILIDYNLFELTKINENLISSFRILKNKYLNNEKIPIEEYTIFKNLYESNRLNVSDEYYYYISLYNLDFKKILTISTDITYGNIYDLIEKIANLYKINSELLKEMIYQYFNALFIINKKEWMHTYELNNHLLEDEEINQKENIIDLVKKKFNFPLLFNNNQKQNNGIWDIILETYLRAFSMNLLKNEGKYYLRLSKGVRINPKFWSDSIKIENTFLGNKMDFIIYHYDGFSNNEHNVIYLTSVKIEWILQLNPIYYYYFFFDTNNIIHLLNDDIDVIRSKNIINNYKQYFNIIYLISYIDQLNNKYISEIIRDKILSDKKIE